MARATTTKKTTPRTTKAAATKTAATKTATSKTKTTAARSRKTTAAKPPTANARGDGAAKAAVAKVATPSTKLAAIAPQGPQATVSSEMKKRELYERVSTMSGVKKQQVKPVVDAMLAVLGETLEAGKDLNLEPLGKVKIQRQKDAGTAKVITCRVRRKVGKAPINPAAKTALAKAK